MSNLVPTSHEGPAPTEPSIADRFAALSFGGPFTGGSDSSASNPPPPEPVRVFNWTPSVTPAAFTPPAKVDQHKADVAYHIRASQDVPDDFDRDAGNGQASSGAKDHPAPNRARAEEPAPAQPRAKAKRPKSKGKPKGVVAPKDPASHKPPAALPTASAASPAAAEDNSATIKSSLSSFETTHFKVNTAPEYAGLYGMQTTDGDVLNEHPDAKVIRAAAVITMLKRGNAKRFHTVYGVGDSPILKDIVIQSGRSFEVFTANAKTSTAFAVDCLDMTPSALTDVMLSLSGPMFKRSIYVCVGIPIGSAGVVGGVPYMLLADPDGESPGYHMVADDQTLYQHSYVWKHSMAIPLPGSKLWMTGSVDTTIPDHIHKGLGLTILKFAISPEPTVQPHLGGSPMVSEHTIERSLLPFRPYDVTHKVLTVVFNRLRASAAIRAQGFRLDGHMISQVERACTEDPTFRRFERAFPAEAAKLRSDTAMCLSTVARMDGIAQRRDLAALSAPADARLRDMYQGIHSTFNARLAFIATVLFFAFFVLACRVVPTETIPWWAQSTVRQQIICWFTSPLHGFFGGWVGDQICGSRMLPYIREMLTHVGVVGLVIICVQAAIVLGPLRVGGLEQWPLSSAIAEELLILCLSTRHGRIVRALFILYFVKRGMFGPAIIHAAAHLWMPYTSFVHLLWNACVSYVLCTDHPDARFGNFAHMYHEMPECMEVIGHSLDGPIAAGQRLGTMHAHIDPNVLDPKATLKIKYNGQVTLPQDVPKDPRAFVLSPIIAHNGLLHALTPGAHSTVAAAVMRTCARTAYEADRDYLEPVTDDFIDAIRGWAEPLELDFEAYKTSSNTRRVRMIDEEINLIDVGAMEDTHSPEGILTAEDSSVQYIGAIGKTGGAPMGETQAMRTQETISGQYLPIGSKPRMIGASSSSHIAVTSSAFIPLVDVFKKALTEDDGVPRTFYMAAHTAGRALSISFAFASGMDDGALSRWANMVTSDDPSLAPVHDWECAILVDMIFNGDDMLAYVKIPQRRLEFWLELDYSMYDQTQKTTLLECADRVYELFGVPQAIIDVNARMQQLDLRFKNKHCTMLAHGSSDRVRVTGANDTTIGGSICNIIVNVSMFTRVEMFSGTVNDLHNRMIKAYTECGVTPKLALHPSIADTTFLRGRYYATVEGPVVWAWLPSAICKVTKVLSPLRTSADVRAAAKAMRSCIGKAGSMAEQLPVLRSLVRCYDRCSTNARDLKVTSESYRPTMSRTNRTLDMEAALAWMCAHYETTVLEILDLEAGIDAITTLPFLYCHPLLYRLMDVDYA